MKDRLYLGLERDGDRIEVEIAEPPLLRVSHGRLSVQAAWKSAVESLTDDLAREVAAYQAPGLEPLREIVSKHETQGG